MACRRSVEILNSLLRGRDWRVEMYMLGAMDRSLLKEMYIRYVIDRLLLPEINIWDVVHRSLPQGYLHFHDFISWIGSS